MFSLNNQNNPDSRSPWKEFHIRSCFDTNHFWLSAVCKILIFIVNFLSLKLSKFFYLFFQDLPPSLAHALISILCNVKLWLNYRAVPQLFTPVRTNALRYMCELSDAELRQQHPRQIGKIKEIF